MDDGGDFNLNDDSTGNGGVIDLSCVAMDDTPTAAHTHRPVAPKLETVKVVDGWSSGLVGLPVFLRRPMSVRWWAGAESSRSR